MTLEYTEIDQTHIVELSVSGRVSKEDYDAVVPPLQDFIDRHGQIKVIEIVESFGGFDPSILLPGLEFDLKNISHVSHAAIVTDIGWLSPFARAVGSLLPLRLRTFPTSELGEARKWIASV